MLYRLYWFSTSSDFVTTRTWAASSKLGNKFCLGASWISRTVRFPFSRSQREGTDWRTLDVLAPGIRKSWSPKYKLFGVLYHHGLSSSGGYYTLDVLHPTRYAGVGVDVEAREGWVRIDDELVSDVRHEEVFKAWDWNESRSPYLLFYRRVR
jgi:hypothetical protein